MKLLTFILTFTTVVFFTACEKENINIENNNVPEEVGNAFKLQYENVTDVQWEREGEHYVAEFEQNGFEKDITYDKNGKFISSETEIPVDGLLPAIVNYINNSYSGYSLSEAERIENNNGTSYEVEITKGKEELELIFDGQGNFLGQEMEDDDNDEEEGEDDDLNEKEIDPKALPQNIQSNIQNRYPGAEMMDADEITLKDGSITYDVEIKTNETIIELMYSADGTFLGIEQDDSDENDSED